MASVAIIEDDPGIRSLLRMTLELEHYTVHEAEDGAGGVQMIADLAASGTLPDLILLDIMLPKLSGYEVFRHIQAYQIPVIFLSAKSEVTDKVFGLKLGANDYITKPFEPMELLARVEAAIRTSRNSSHPAAEQILTYNDIEILPREREVRKNHQPVNLTIKEYELFLFLVEHVNTAFSREQLLQQLWGYDYYGGTRTIDVHIAQLRQKLGLQKQILTVYKLGYKLIPPANTEMEQNP